jgi:putative spermidine/putrescine transport system permease protein
VLASVLGTLAAFGVRRVSDTLSAVLLSVFIAPLIVPVVVLAAGAYFMLSAIGLIGTYAGMVALHAVLGIPYVVLVVSAALKRFDPSLERAAQISGANPSRVLMRVTVPILAPAIITGSLFAFVRSSWACSSPVLTGGRCPSSSSLEFSSRSRR